MRTCPSSTRHEKSETGSASSTRAAGEACISAHGGYTHHAGSGQLGSSGRTTEIPNGARLYLYTLHGSAVRRGAVMPVFMGRRTPYLTAMNGGQIYDYHLSAYQGDNAEIDRYLRRQREENGIRRDIICLRTHWWGRGTSLGSILRQVQRVHRYEVYHFCACRSVAGRTMLGAERQEPYIPIRR